MYRYLYEHFNVPNEVLAFQSVFTGAQKSLRKNNFLTHFLLHYRNFTEVEHQKSMFMYFIILLIINSNNNNVYH